MDRQLEVLLVEDNTDHVFLMKAALEELGERFPATIHVVTDGQEAIDYVEKSPPYVNSNYELGSNSYISKPTGTDELAAKLESLGMYWFATNRLPSKSTV